MRLWSRWPFGCSPNGVMHGGSVVVRRWLHEDDGQDLIEYALLCSVIGFVGILAIDFIGAAMNTTYTSWDNAIQDDALVEVPDPVDP